MAIVKCRECGNSISNEAPMCPHCGAPGFGQNAMRGTPTAPKKPATIGTIPGLAIMALVVYVGFKFATGVTSAPVSRPAATPIATPEPSAISAAVEPEKAERTKEELQAQLVADFAAGGGAWEVNVRKDAMTGGTNVILSTPATQYGKDKFGRQVEGDLIVQCRENSTGLVVELSDFISTQSVTVSSRIDSKPAQTRPWQISTDYQAVFAPNAIATLKALERAEMFTVRITPHGESPMDFPFVVTGLAAHLPKVRKACNW